MVRDRRVILGRSEAQTRESLDVEAPAPLSAGDARVEPEHDARVLSWHLMIAADLPAVMEIAAEVHPSYPEDEAVFAERLNLAPEGCRLLVDADGNPRGYLVSHPWPRGGVPALNALLGDVPPQCGNWYIHDLALLPAARGSGAAAEVVAEIARLAAAKGCAALALVAVGGSAGFWRRQGFRELPDPALADKLASYDAAACYMLRELDSPALTGALL